MNTPRAMHQRTDILLRGIVLLSALLAGAAWAGTGTGRTGIGGTGAPVERGSGIGGTGAVERGTGIGGTGTVAKGTGIGGTGTVAKGTGIGGTGEPVRVAGNVIFSSGTVEAQRAGQTRLLAKGAPVYEGETIVTAQAGMVQIRMADNGMLSVRPNTRMRIDVFRFDGKEDGTERSLIYLAEGGFRALTGMIGHLNKANYKIQTPNVTIGIRGTDHEPMVVPPPAPGQVAQDAPGTYDKVNSGGVILQGAQGAVKVDPNQIGFAPEAPNAPPVILHETPHFYQVEGEVEGGFRRPEAGEQKEGGEHGERGGQPGGQLEPGTKGEHHEHEGNAPVIRSIDIRAPAPEMHAPEMHAPEVHAPEILVPEVHPPEIQAPGGPGSNDHDDDDHHPPPPPPAH